MPENPPAHVQRLCPSLVYADAPTAIAFLCEAFGLEERFRYANDAGHVGHSSLTYQGTTVLTLSSEYPEAGFVQPPETGTVSVNLYLYVDDVDAHHERARAAGARIEQEPLDQFWGDRTYRAVDPGGYLWTFATNVRDVDIPDSRPGA